MARYMTVMIYPRSFFMGTGAFKSKGNKPRLQESHNPPEFTVIIHVQQEDTCFRFSSS